MTRIFYYSFTAIILLVVGGVNQSVYGVLSDNVMALNNSFSAASVFPSPSASGSPLPSGSPGPSGSPVPSSSPSISPSPLPSSSPSGININISGNGSGSHNVVNVNNSSDCLINQTNTTSVNNNIVSNANSGLNNIWAAIASSSGTLQSGSSTSNVTVSVIGGTNNSFTGCP